MTANTTLLVVKLGIGHWLVRGLWREKAYFTSWVDMPKEPLVEAKPGMYCIGGSFVWISRRFLGILRNSINDQIGDFADPFSYGKVYVRFHQKRV